MFIPELTTRVSVEVDTSELDNAIQVAESDDIISQIGLGDILAEKKNTIFNLRAPLAKAVAEGLQFNQENIIASKHHISGMMSSVDIDEDGPDFLVGTTAASVDGFPYPLAIEKGSKDHWVAPVTYDALHWVHDDKDMFSKGHMVSGITADPFVEPSIKNTMWDIDEIIDEVLGDL